MKLDKVFSSKRQAIEKTKSTIITVVVIASILVSFSIVTTKFLWDLRAYNARVISKKEDARDTLKNNLESVATLKTKFADFENIEPGEPNVNSQLVLDALPSKYDYAALISSIDGLAARSGVIFKSFNGQDASIESPQTSSNPTPLAIDFSVTVEGSYEAITEFIKVLDKSIRPMQVTYLELSGSDANMKAEISITTYYQPKASITIEKEVVQ